MSILPHITPYYLSGTPSDFTKGDLDELERKAKQALRNAASGRSLISQNSDNAVNVSDEKDIHDDNDKDDEDDRSYISSSSSEEEEDEEYITTQALKEEEEEREEDNEDKGLLRNNTSEKAKDWTLPAQKGSMKTMQEYATTNTAETTTGGSTGDKATKAQRRKRYGKYELWEICNNVNHPQHANANSVMDSGKHNFDLLYKIMRMSRPRDETVTPETSRDPEDVLVERILIASSKRQSGSSMREFNK